VRQLVACGPATDARIESSMRPTVAEIQKAVCDHFQISETDLLSQRRAREVARPRQVAFYLCRNLTLRSLPEIGRMFAGRDHTTVIHGIRTVAGLIKTNPEIAVSVDRIGRRIAVATERRARLARNF
jgi:chromosomal replication initiator protein